MQKYFAFASALIALGTVSIRESAHSQTDPPTQNDLRYQKAESLLTKGRDLQTTIAHFSILTKKEPKNAQYHLLLGCAYASRMASFACAMDDATVSYAAQKLFQKRLKIWQQMRNNPAMPLFGTPQPAAPLSASTPDDGKLYTITGKTEKGEKPDITEEEHRTLVELAEKALNSFDTARDLSRPLPQKDQVQIAYTCGWGMLLIYRYGKDILPFEASASVIKKEAQSSIVPNEKQKLVLKQDEIIACFRECTEYDKKKADYWQSLAFAYAPDYLTDIYRSDDIEKITQSKTNQVEKSVQNLRRALKLKRDDAQLLYQIAIVSAFDRSQDAIGSLKKLTEVEDQNAVCFYLQGDAQLNRATELKGDAATQMMTEGITALQAGNRASGYRNIAMILPVSKWLQAAWSYQPLYGIGSDSRFLEYLFSYLNDAAKEALQNKQGDRAMAIGTTMMEMGLNALKHYHGDDLDPASMRTQLTLYYRGLCGILCCGKAHKQIQAAAELSPSPANLLLASRYAQYEDYWKAWDAALILR